MHMGGIATQYLRGVTLGGHVTGTNPKEHPAAGELGIQKGCLIIGKDTAEHSAGGSNPTRSYGPGRDRRRRDASGRNRKTCSRQACDRRRKTGPENAALPNIGVADKRLARSCRIIGDTPHVAQRTALGGGLVREKAKIGTVKAFALQLGNRRFEFLRIIKNCYSLADYHGVHAALRCS